MDNKIKFLVWLMLVNVFDGISGHGMIMDPVNRASRWRIDNSTPRDYNDMEGFCGGYPVQWEKNGGKCGLCGDSFDIPTPRYHELGGMFGQGVIVSTYKQGSTISVTAKITANHRGYFYFRICNVDNERESDDCFNRYKLLTASGTDTYELPSTDAKDYIMSLRLPSDLTCNHCVLQWTYVAGNNWGWCPDGTGKLGCGPQEHFRTCSDIKITK